MLGNLFKRLLSLFFFAIFVLSTLVQLNDPDPEVWVPYYSAAALLPLLAFIGIDYSKSSIIPFISYLLRIAVIVVSLCWIQLYHADVWEDYKAKNGDVLRMVMAKDGDISMKDQNMEQAREFFGVCIILLYTLLIYPFSFPTPSSTKTKAT